MRRSKAPSVLNKTKQLGGDECLNPEEQYDWGSRNIKSKKLNGNKRIFNVLWRDVSNRKHKIWKGDGSLEVDIMNLKAILKDELGKYVGCSTHVEIKNLVPDFQMIISGKEIEIQNEIKDNEELENLRETQAENLSKAEWTFAKDELEETKKSKGNFKFNPILILRSPKFTTGERAIEKGAFKFEGRTGEFLTDSINITKPRLKPDTSNKFLCFVKPSELQQLIFQKVLEYLSAKCDNIQSFNVEHALKMVCNHPSLINTKTNTNELLRNLIPFLPHWTEMGPFDSGKLEFVQSFLTDLTKSKLQSCIILAKNSNALNMLQGLCDFMKIKSLRPTLEFCFPKDGATYVVLVDSLEVLKFSEFSAFCKKIIIFEEYLEFSKMCSVENFKDLTIYYLVTAFSIEELFLLDTYSYKNIAILLNDLANVNDKEHDCCYLHSKIGCSCFENAGETINTENIFIKYWNHYKTPFDFQLLKVSSLENSTENIVSIFCAKNK